MELTIKNNLKSFVYVGTDNKIKDITGLENLTALQKVILNNNEVKDISKLNNLPNLKRLEIVSNGLEELPVLSNLKKLIKLDISDNKITKIENLKDLQIKILVAKNNEIENIEPLANLTNLQELDLSSNKINDISQLTGLTGLKKLIIAGNSIENISPVSELINLEKIDISNQHIEKNTETNTVILPQIFITSQDIDNIGQVNQELLLDNCMLSEDGTKVVIIDTLKDAKITINGGMLKGSELLIPYDEENGFRVFFENFVVEKEDNVQYVTQIQPNTTVEQIKEAVQTTGEVTIKTNGQIINTGIVATGDRIIVTRPESSKELIIVVKGDTTGDGKIDYNDILRINDHRLENQKLYGAYAKAGDINNDGRLNFKDISVINKFRLGKINEL